MRAMILHQHAPAAAEGLRLGERPVSESQAGELLVKVACCAICRTDLHVIEGELPLEKANAALQDLHSDRIAGSGVLVP